MQILRRTEAVLSRLGRSSPRWTHKRRENQGRTDITRRFVNTWSPLASAFNAKPNKLLSLHFTKGATVSGVAKGVWGYFGMVLEAE